MTNGRNAVSPQQIRIQQRSRKVPVNDSDLPLAEESRQLMQRTQANLLYAQRVRLDAVVIE
ncbi:MAG: hypothetical protein EXS16_20845 [Gemmataceae bacterium]|nr:hypothetical protein [Gemmataceae bacterium]